MPMGAMFALFCARKGRIATQSRGNVEPSVGARLGASVAPWAPAAPRPRQDLPPPPAGRAPRPECCPPAWLYSPARTGDSTRAGALHRKRSSVTATRVLRPPPHPEPQPQRRARAAHVRRPPGPPPVWVQAPMENFALTNLVQLPRLLQARTAREEGTTMSRRQPGALW